MPNDNPMKTARFVFMLREQAEITAPSTNTEMDTFVATFTQFGAFKDQALEFPITPEGGTVNDKGQKIYDEGKLAVKNEIYFTKDNESGLKALRGKAVDILCFDRKSECSHVLPDNILNYGFSAKHGDYRVMPLDMERIDDFDNLKIDIWHGDLT